MNPLFTEHGVIHEGSGGWLLVSDEALVVRLPYPVSANRLWVSERGNKPRQSNEVVAYKTHVRLVYRQLLKIAGLTPLECSLDARIEVQPRKHARRFNESTYPRFDADNYQKCLFDALKGDGLLYRDDKQIVSATLRFAEPVTHGCVWLSVRPAMRSWLAADVDFDWLMGGV